MRRIKISLSFAAMVCILTWLDWRICLRFLLCAVIHEIGHLIAMKLCKVRCNHVTIGMDGARIEAAFPSYGIEFLCAVSGPLFGILFAFIFAHYAPRTAIISLFLSIVNLLPLYPLDGGRMIKAALCMYIDTDKARKVLRMISAGTSCILMLLACWGAAEWQAGLWPIFASLILLFRSGRD